MTTTVGHATRQVSVEEIASQASALSQKLGLQVSLRVHMRPFPIERLLPMLQPFGVHMTSKAQDLYVELEIHERYRGDHFTPGPWPASVVSVEDLSLSDYAPVDVVCNTGSNRSNLRFCPAVMALQIATSPEHRPPDGQMWIVCSEPTTKLFTVISEEKGALIDVIAPRTVSHGYHRFVFTTHRK